jgi:hypothetical protein
MTDYVLVLFEVITVSSSVGLVAPTVVVVESVHAPHFPSTELLLLFTILFPLDLMRRGEIHFPKWPPSFKQFMDALAAHFIATHTFVRLLLSEIVFTYPRSYS